MLYNYACAYQSISFKKFKIVSPDVNDNVNNLCDLFTNVAGDTILKLLKEIDLYPKI